MQNYSLRQFGRTILTITGILLLVIFGSRAASQATSLSAVGGQTKHSLFPIALTASQLVAIAGMSTQHTATSAYELAAVTSASGNELQSNTTEQGNGVAKAASHIKKAASQLADETEGDVTAATQAATQGNASPQKGILQTDVK
ncbi:MAG TPA: hypothetical protein VFI84_03585 [Candidatus Saccharimonadales bacterium]|nr:hypothetical protein [Candidatus Saccharimonadales bacterium]